jgi:hypothetical protein
MQILDWLNENEYRCYPLQEGTNRGLWNTTELNKCLLDALFISTTPAKLNSFIVAGDIVSVHVSKGSIEEVFTFNKTESFPQSCRLSSGSLLVAGHGLLGATASVTFSDVWFDHCAITAPMPVCVSSLNTQEGETTLLGGLQTGLVYNDKNNTITVKADRNVGVPIQCHNYFQTVVQADCGNIVTSLHGAAPSSNPGKIRLKTEGNIRIFEDPANFRIYIGLDFRESDLCRVKVNPSASL